MATAVDDTKFFNMISPAENPGQQAHLLSDVVSYPPKIDDVPARPKGGRTL